MAYLEGIMPFISDNDYATLCTIAFKEGLEAEYKVQIAELRRQMRVLEVQMEHKKKEAKHFSTLCVGDKVIKRSILKKISQRRLAAKKKMGAAPGASCAGWPARAGLSRRAAAASGPAGWRAAA